MIFKKILLNFALRIALITIKNYKDADKCLKLIEEEVNKFLKIKGVKKYETL